MDPRKFRLGLLLSAGAMALAFLLRQSPQAALLSHAMWPAAAVAGGLFLIAAWMANERAAAVGIGGAVLGATASLGLLGDPEIAGSARIGFWMIVIAVWLSAAMSVVSLAAMRPVRIERRMGSQSPGSADLRRHRFLSLGSRCSRLRRAAGANAVAKCGGRQFVASLPILGADFVQTFVRGVLAGYAIGCGAGLSWSPSWRIGTHFSAAGFYRSAISVSALPLVGIAPIMVMWFGFDWPSKAAVVVAHDLLPDAGQHAGRACRRRPTCERDLMRTYAASYWQTPRASSGCRRRCRSSSTR